MTPLVKLGDVGAANRTLRGRRLTPLDGFVEVPRDDVRRWAWWVTAFWLGYAAVWVAGLVWLLRVFS